MSGWSLPEELIIEILARLPVKSVVRFRVVCKRWLTLTGKKSFIIKHQRNKNANSITWNDENTSTLPSSINRIGFFLGIYSFLPPGLIPSHHEVSYCNGLFCFFRRRDGRFTLSNPALRDSQELPPFDLELLHLKGESPVITVFGLGFDPETEDYKVVGIAIFWDGPSDTRIVNYAKVYSKSKGTWTSVIDHDFEDTILKNVSFLHGSRGISQYTLDGSLHWSVIKRVEEVNTFVELILSFDLKDGVFRLTEFPKEYYQFHVELPPFQSFSQGNNRARSLTWRIRDHSVSTLNGKLAFLASFYDGSRTSIDVWVMENVGGEYSWSHVLNVDPRPGLRHAMCFWRNGEIVIIKGCDEDDHTQGWPFLYDPAVNKMKEVTLSGEFDFIYRECLVPVKRVTGEELEGSRS